MPGDNIIKSAYQGMTEEQLRADAYKTREELSKMSSDELISLNNDVIVNALKLIRSSEFKSQSMKQLLKDLIVEITKLYDVCFKLYNAKSVNYFASVVDSEGMNSSLQDIEDSKIKQLEFIQDELIKDNKEIMSNISSDKTAIENAIAEIVTKHGLVIKGTEDIESSIKEAIKELTRFSVLDPLINQKPDVPFNEFIEEIRVDDYNDIRILVGGKEERTNITFDSPAHLAAFSRILRNSVDTKQELSRAKPLIRFRLGDTTRVSMMRDPISRRDKRVHKDQDVLHIVIRSQRTQPLTSAKLLELGSVNEYLDTLIRFLFKSGISTAVIGGTGSGKTSMTNAYLPYIDSRTISMAEVDEMNMRRIDFAKEATNSEGVKYPNPNYMKAKNSVLMWECANPEQEILPGLKWFEGMANAALTMTPSAIVLQETKGSEFTDLINLALSDHQIITSVHSSDVESFVLRGLKLLKIRAGNISEDILIKEIIQAFPAVLVASKYKDGTRKISSAVELTGYDPETKKVLTNTLVTYKVEKNIIEDGKFKTIGKHEVYQLPSEKLMQTMLRKGLLEKEKSKLEALYQNVRVSDEDKDYSYD